MEVGHALRKSYFTVVNCYSEMQSIDQYDFELGQFESITSDRLIADSKVEEQYFSSEYQQKKFLKISQHFLEKES